MGGICHLSDDVKHPPKNIYHYFGELNESLYDDIFDIDNLDIEI